LGQEFGQAGLGKLRSAADELPQFLEAAVPVLHRGSADVTPQFAALSKL